MSSWLANLANSLGVDDDDHNNYKQPIHNNNEQSPSSPKSQNEDSSSEIPGRGVKEDLSELTKTLTRQLWGVASFLAPPPTPTESSSPSPTPAPPSISDWNRWDSSDQQSVDDSSRISGIRNDFAEIGGRFRTGLSKLSNHKAVSEFSKMASTLLPFGSEMEDGEGEVEGDVVGDAVGVTKEVLAFARNIARHPETWLDFPLADDEDSDDFDMSDAQQEHALAVERLAPRLAALRIELCPGYMSEGCFWKIYFVLLHPRLNKQDALLLSTPQIVEARALLTQDLQNRTKSQELSHRPTSFSNESIKEDHYSSSDNNNPSETMPLKTFACDPDIVETDKHQVESSEMQIVDKSIVEEEPPSAKFLDQKFDDDDGDDWLKDESSEMIGYSGTTTVPLGNEEDVSFSDLEEDDDDDGKSVTIHKSLKFHANVDDKDANDWLDIDEKDVI
ncbi:hypothetical protein ACHQM5_024824 [Ranunculus cassubicifolius]